MVRQWAQRLDDLRENLSEAARRTLQSRHHALDLLQARLAAHHPARELENRRGHLAQLSARLRALGPQATLDRGYALVLDQKGRPLSQAEKTREGQAVRIVLSKGMVGAKLTDAQPGKTLLDALHPQAPEAAAVPVEKRKLRRKNAN